MKLDELLDMWKIDSKIDESNISRELLNIPLLHSKYLNILENAHLSKSKNFVEYDKLKNIKNEYYLGNLDKETLEEYGWEQFDRRIGTKSNIDLYLNSDNDLCKISLRIEYFSRIIHTAEHILNELKNRHFLLQSYIKWETFKAGN